MIVKKSDFEADPAHYLELSEHEEIVVVQDGERVATLTGAKRNIFTSLAAKRLGDSEAP